MNFQLKKIARFFGRTIGKRRAENLIVFLQKCTDANILKLALNHYGILKYEDMTISGEKFVLEEIVKTCTESDDVLIDVGANVGEYSRALLSLFPDSRILSFEPNPITFQDLKENVDTEVYNLAISTKIGQLEFYTSEEQVRSTQASFARESIPKDETVKKILVESMRLEDIFVEKEISKVGLLKIDTEGFDLEVVKSCGESIGTIKFIQFEFNEKYVYTRTFLKDFHDALSQTHGLFRIDSDRLHDIQDYLAVHEIFRYQNILGIRKDLIPRALREIKVQ